jgi:hypothetical protein
VEGDGDGCYAEEFHWEELSVISFESGVCVTITAVQRNLCVFFSNLAFGAS